MKTSLYFDPTANQLTGPAGALSIAPEDALAHRFLMLLEGQCLEQNIGAVAQKYGYCRQRYYQLLEAFQHGGVPALRPKKTGPKSTYRRTEAAVRQVLRHLFLDPEASPAVVVQKLRQSRHAISLRSVQRVIADYGLQKKTLPPQPQKPAARSAHPARQKTNPPRTGRRRQRGTGGATAPGR